MNERLAAYAQEAGPDVIEHLCQLARPLEGKTVVHVNSTRHGGGVAEILACLVPLMRDLGLDVSWEVIAGEPEFFRVTKALHNGLQGEPVTLGDADRSRYFEVSRRNAESLRARLEAADFVFIHDPQPAGMHGLCPKRRGKWVWRCHIDASRPSASVWGFVSGLVSGYDASVFSLAAFARVLPHPQYLIPPSIDPLSEKNAPLDREEIERATARFGLDPERPVVLQVSRFDRFKDPVGVVKAYRIARRHTPLQLVLAGGEATDDPEGAAVLEEVREAAGDDPDIHLLLLPSDSHRAINALQRRADVVLQKSLREGFGLTVTEAMWKGQPVIGGETGGITLQVVNGHTGFLVNTPEGAAFRMRYLLSRPEERARMGGIARRFVRENFLLTRHLREYLTLMVSLQHGARERIEVG